MRRKALFFDIDGTLLDNRTKKIPESAERAVCLAREAGHLVFINTGRARCLMHEVEAIPLDGFLCGCGTYIEVDGKVLLHNLISASRRLEMQNSILDYGLDGILEGCDACYAQSRPSSMQMMEAAKKMYSKGKLLTADWREAPLPFDKFCVLADENSDTVGYLKTLAPDITVIDRGRKLYECVPAGFTKATAMEFILDYFDIPWEESYAFGDSTNDLAMIRYACNSVIMGKHDQELEQYASFITKNVEDDGIAYAFEQLNII